jgi:predicted metal-dependent phosphoesterase TrpH
MIIDMHIHTRFSPCSGMRIKHLVGKAKERGLNGICITDHDTTASLTAFQNIYNETGICIIVGLEYTTQEGDFLVFCPTKYFSMGMGAEDLLQWAEKEGAIVIPAHPFRKSRPADPAILKSFNIIERLNGRNHPSENEACKAWLKQYGNGTRTVGGSDAHTPDEIGRVVTVFEKDICSIEDLIRELRSGHYSPQYLHSR